MKFRKKQVFFGKNLRHLRKIKGIRQAELGKMLGYEANTISGYETGKSTPDFQAFIQLTEIFEISADGLLFTDLATNAESNKPDQPELYQDDTQLNSPDEYQGLRQEMVRLAKEVRGYAKLIVEYKNDLYDLQRQVEKMKKTNTIRKSSRK